MPFRRRCCGDWRFRRRDVSAMVVADVLYEKKCVFEILQWLDCKGYVLDKRFCCHSEGRCGFSSVGSLEELILIPFNS